MVANGYFTRCFTSVRPAVSAFMPSVHARGGARGQYLGHHRFCLISRDQLMDEYYTWDKYRKQKI